MKKFNFYIIALISVFFLVSCGKEGAVGPTGAGGVQGAIGAAGPKGANGQEGSIIYSGTTVPATAIGKVGDYYLNKTTSLLYGPKAAAGWGTGLSLKGATGAKGSAGSNIYKGAVVPAAGLGANGDFYLNSTSYLLYGPKTAAGWGVPISLRGPAGPQGPEGNANVKTDVFSLTNSDWLWNSSYSFRSSPGVGSSYFTRYYLRNNNSITQAVLDRGMVLVYFTPNYANTNQWSPLPYQFTDFSLGFDYNIAFETSRGSVKLHYFFVRRDATAVLPELSTYNIANYKFKIVAVSGELGTFMVAHHIDLSNYKDVSKVTGLWQQDKN
ncbi:hypothetical protein ABIB40_000880 [Pedobacter sp. UYP30]|uniref:hypothetical protein n=1 Tax=Pedobacter sp. UYP30 TaxID=1756400 RepID=UPI003395D021